MIFFGRETSDWGRGLGGDGNNLYPERVLGCTYVCICQISKTIHLTFVSFTVYEVYIKKKKQPESKYINGMHAEGLERE